MGTDSKERNEKLKWLKNKLFSFNLQKFEKVYQCVNKISKLPDGAVIPDIFLIPEKEDIETKRFAVSFEWIDESKCDFCSVVESKALAIIDKLKKVSTTSFKDFKNLGTRNPPIKKNGGRAEYDSLFKNLPEDVEEIHELPFTGDGRIFFFLDVGANFYLISIKTKHINLHSE